MISKQQNLLRLIHIFIILIILYVIVNGKLCPHYLAVVEIVLTISRAVIERRIGSNRTKLQILVSLLLGYLIFPNRMRDIGWLFFVKTIQIHQSLKAVRESLSSKQSCKYIACIYDFIRFTLNQFMVLGIFSLLYHFACDETESPVPQTHTLIYQLVVTASTIGYGDVTPKSKMQIIFYTYTIPIICASFVIYVNSLVEIYNKTFLEESEDNETKAKCQ